MLTFTSVKKSIFKKSLVRKTFLPIAQNISTSKFMVHIGYYLTAWLK